MAETRPPLPALTIHQPWAWAIAGGWKPVENRDWPAPDRLLGRYLAIHAGRQYDADAARDLVRHRELLGLPAGVPDGKSIVLGAIVAVAKVAGVVLAEPFDHEEPLLVVKEIRGAVTPERAAELARSPWARGPFLWVLEDVTAIDPPVPCRGLQKLWTVPAAEADTVRERYRAARRAA